MASASQHNNAVGRAFTVLPSRSSAKEQSQHSLRVPDFSQLINAQMHKFQRLKDSRPLAD